nr:MAG TPA: hypothetical protein [Caudoviricetes sp.]
MFCTCIICLPFSAFLRIYLFCLAGYCRRFLYLNKLFSVCQALFLTLKNFFPFGFFLAVLDCLYLTTFFKPCQALF